MRLAQEKAGQCARIVKAQAKCKGGGHNPWNVNYHGLSRSETRGSSHPIFDKPRIDWDVDPNEFHLLFKSISNKFKGEEEAPIDENQVLREFSDLLNASAEASALPNVLRLEVNNAHLATCVLAALQNMCPLLYEKLPNNKKFDLKRRIEKLIWVHCKVYFPSGRVDAELMKTKVV